MITILTATENIKAVQDSINSVDRLNEIVTVNTTETKESSTLIVTDGQIKSTIDWFDNEPPYIFPSLEFETDNLLGLIFYKLGNHQRAFEYIQQDNSFYNHLLTATSIQFGYEITEEQANFVKEFSTHNYAIVLNYGNISFSVKPNQVQEAYENALKKETNNEVKLLTAKDYINYLIDSGLYSDAEKLINSVTEKTTTESQKQAFKVLLASCLKLQLTVPYNDNELNKLITLQKECVDYYQSKEMDVNAGLLLIDASEVATLQKDFSTAKDLIGKAVLIFTEADIEELLGEATLQRASLLYAWSKNDSPQYYKPAINSFQNALKIFKRDTHPQKYADIHHNLALIYSEIKVMENEKPIWTAFCASSFKDALKFYTKENFPYQFAMVAHNYATALMGFPEAKLHNNLDTAYHLFEEVLEIRTAEKLPFERSLTLLNQLELFWLLHNENEEDEKNRFEEMTHKANEIKTLVTDSDLIEKASQHLVELEKLKPILK
ncbi:MAG: hypothetical protein COA33_011115 [Fluviicola sp.]|nr:hypothetical protein [Fluviicola sp.]